MRPSGPPPSVSWMHQGIRTGFEVAYFERVADGYVITGSTTAVEDGDPWIVGYEVRVRGDWTTRTARLHGRSRAGSHTLAMDADGRGHWRIDRQPVAALDGCLDVDLGSSVMTNALPVWRLALAPGQRASAPAAYARSPDLRVERLEQAYLRTDDEGVLQAYDYAAPAFNFACRLVYDEAGLVLEYPGIGVRVS